MCFFPWSNKPSAKIADGRLVLSMPDAQTPALWIMPLSDAATAVLRLETDRQGFFALKKHSGKSTVETIAIYREHKQALRALKAASAALEKTRVAKKSSRAWRYFTYVTSVWFVLYISGLDMSILRAVDSLLTPAQKTVSAQQQQPQQLPPQEQPQAQAPVSGVPMSAEDFLQRQLSAPGF